MKQNFYVIVLIFIGFFIGITVPHADNKNKTENLNKIGIVEQYTCSGRFQRKYEKCSNFRIEDGFTTFDIKDYTNDVSTVKLVGGIITIELKNIKENK